MHESILLDGGGVRIGFHWHRDRYAHTIGAIDGDRLEPLLASREGAPTDLWPPSPPFQEVHIEQRAGNSVALLVGRSGGCHWSASIEVDAASSALHFDVACRIKAMPTRGSEEHIAQGTAQGAVQKSVPMIATSAYQAMVMPTGDSQGTIQVVTERAALDIASNRVDDTIEPATLAHVESGFQFCVPPSTDEAPCTIRWRYTISRSI